MSTSSVLTSASASRGLSVQHEHDAANERAGRDRGWIADRDQRQQRRRRKREDEDEARGHAQPAQPDVERHAVGARARHARPQAHERREPDEQRHPDPTAYACAIHGTRPAAREHDHDGRRGGEIGRVRVGAEPRVLPCEPLGEPVRGGEAPQQALGVRQRRVGGGEQQQHRRDGDQDPGDAAGPRRAGQVLAQAGKRRGEP